MSKKLKAMRTAVSELIVDGKFAVAKQGSDLTLLKMVGGKPVTIVLKHTEKGYWIQPATTNYKCTNSHFDYTEPETRFTRRKDVIIRLVQKLQKTKLWDHVVNKNFFEPNKANTKVTHSVVEAQYKSILNIQ